MNRQESSESHERQKKQSRKKEVVFISSDKSKFKEVAQGAAMAILWGNEETGQHGAITRFDPGFDAGMHTHTSDSRIVVIKGAYLYRDASGEKRVGPGDFIYIPGGMKHWSGGDAKEGALFYNVMSGKFDLIPMM